MNIVIDNQNQSFDRFSHLDGYIFVRLTHSLNMELDLKSLFGLQPPCAQLYSLAETPQLPPSPRIWAHKRGRYWSAKIDDISL
jgi:hypothetical protein